MSNVIKKERINGKEEEEQWFLFFNFSATKKFSKGTNASIFRVHQIKHPTLIADEKSRAATKQIHWHPPQMK